MKYSHDAGHLDVYAIAVEIFVPIIGVWDQYLVKSGSSYAAAQVAGLAAYLMTAPSEERFRPGNVASAVKKRIVALARTANGPGKMLIYNGVREAFCRVGGRPAPKLKPRGALWQYPTVERSNLVARQDTSNSSKTTVYAGGFWAFDASQSSVSRPLSTVESSTKLILDPAVLLLPTCRSSRLLYQPIPS